MGLRRFSLHLRLPTAIVAALAVLLQLAVAATHHHAHDGPGTSFGSQDRLASAAFDPAEHGQAPPANESACQICLGLALGGAFLPPPAILLDRPAPDRATIDRAASRPVARHTAAFRSRAPPVPLPDSL